MLLFKQAINKKINSTQIFSIYIKSKFKKLKIKLNKLSFAFIYTDQYFKIVTP